MLTKVRIEVEEQTVAETVEALAKYEHAIVCAEAQRYEAQWPREFVADPLRPEEHDARTDPSSYSNWNMPFEEREFFAMELGRELMEQVIEYDPGLPGWKGRVVFRYRRLDTRSDAFLPISEPISEPTSGGDNFERNSVTIEHGRFFPASGSAE